MQRYLSQCGIASRRHAEELIEAGKVKINGKVATLGQSINPAQDEVTVNGKKAEPQLKGVALFNKPAGVVTTMRDPHGRRSISDFLPEHLKSYFPVGRLDFESIGLVVLTNDGDLADRLLHPKYEILRVYQIRVVGIPPKDMYKKAAAGVKLEDGVVKADVKFLRQVEGAAWLQVTLHVGKNRVVRRMFEALGYPVRRLIRISHGPFNLGDLKSGEVRELTERQYLRVRDKVMFSGTKDKKTKSNTGRSERGENPKRFSKAGVKSKKKIINKAVR